MSIQNNVQEIFSQKIIFKFKNGTNEIITEDWFVFKDENLNNTYYDFIQNSLLVKACKYNNVDDLKKQIQFFLEFRINKGYELISMVDQLDSNILILEDHKDILTNLKLDFQIKEVDSTTHFIMQSNEF